MNQFLRKTELVTTAVFVNHRNDVKYITATIFALYVAEKCVNLTFIYIKSVFLHIVAAINAGIHCEMN